jgi:hypothetical protein
MIMLKPTLIVLLGFVITAVNAEEMPAPETTQETITAPEVSPAETVQETPAPPATTDVMTEQSGFSRGSVMRSVFTNGIDNREPVDNMKDVGNKTNRITYFTELRDMAGQTVKHRWAYQGKVMAEVEFSVGGPRWRVWSSKTFIPQWQGEWKVSVVNAAGETISEEMINYKQPVMDRPAEEPVATESPQQVESTTEEPVTKDMQEPAATESP